MALDELIEKTKEQLKQESFTSDEVFQGILQPVLGNLGWDIFNPRVVSRYSGVRRSVGCALCHPESQPVILLLIKKMGFPERENSQLIEKPLRIGAPMAVTTDGREWRFHLSEEQYGYDEQRFCRLDLLECSTKEASSRLMRYLDYERVCSGEAMQDARSDYQKIAQDREKSANFLKVWDVLIKEGEPSLIELLSDKFADLCGYRPKHEDCLHFLKTIIIPAEQSDAGLLKPVKPIKVISAGQGSEKGTAISATKISSGFAEKAQDTILRVTLDFGHSDGKEVIAHNKAVSTYIDTLRRIAKHVGNDKFSALKELQFNRGSLLSQSRDKYHPKHMVADYYVLTHNGTREKEDILREVVQKLGLPANFLRVEII